MAVNNAKIFNGALAGFLGGILAGDTTVDSVASDYAVETLAANAFATQVDAKIAAIGGGATVEQEILIANICRGYMAERPNAISADPAFYDQTANSINAIWSNSNVKLQ